MKYIKLFESFEIDNYYIEIELEDVDECKFIESGNPKKFEELEEKLKGEELYCHFGVEESTISSWLLDMGYDEFDEDTMDDREFNCYKFEVTNDDESNIYIDIFELEDEYYLVGIEEEQIDNHLTNTYICDQWDGLEKLLKDRGLLK